MYYDISSAVSKIEVKSNAGNWRFPFDMLEQANVQVLEKLKYGAMFPTRFSIRLPAMSTKRQEQLNSEVGSIRYDRELSAICCTAFKIKNETAGGFHSSLASGIIPLPHQLHVLNRAMGTNNIRYILADRSWSRQNDQAGMIVKELKSRGLVSQYLWFVRPVL